MIVVPQANPKKDYYEILGVDEDADPETIKKAYKKLARKYHPDRSDEADAEEKFKEIGEAYAVLSDPEKRQRYDQFRQYGRSPGSSGFQFDAEGFDFFDLFRQATGAGSTGGRQGGAGRSPFEDLFGGGSRSGGNGGRVQFQWGPSGGRTQAGPTRGGGAGRAGPRAGSREQTITRRIPLKLAVLGGKLKVKTPRGKTVKLTVDPGTQPGTRLRVPDQGRGGRDLVVELDVKIPDNPTEEQRRAIRENF